METIVQSLLQACELGDPNLLAFCLQYELDLNFVTEDGRTPLMYAITYAGSNSQGKYYRVIEMLLQAGSYPESVDATYGRTPAHWAAFCKQGDILRLLLAAGCNAAMYDLEGLTPFHLAISNDLQHCVEEIVAASPDLIHLPTLSGLMPLMLAALAGNIRLCELFLGHGCDPNVIDENTFQSALHMAAERGHSSIVGLLIKKQAILDAVDSRGVTPVHLASSLPTSDVLATICDIVGSAVLELTDASGLTPLMHACVNGSEACIDFIVKKKVKLLAKDSNEGKTCLHWAAESTICSPNIIRLLCKKKKQLIDDKDAYGRTPLHLAAISGHTEALKVLLDSGCDSSLTDNSQYTAVHWAVVSGQPGTLQELISRGCSTEDKEKNGATPLHLAAQASSVSSDDYGQLPGASEGALKCLNVLVSNGASITVTDNEGRQPLHWALQCHSNTQAVQILIQQGADPKEATSEGLKGLHVAARNGITENCQYLIELEGCDGNEEDDKGQTALFYSVESDAIDCSTYLLSIGCSANHTNKDKRSPVHIAASIGSIEGLQLLSSYNGDVNAKSIDCLTPLHDAAANGHTGAVKYLLNAGSDPNISTSTEHTNVASPLHYAVSEGYTECAALLLGAGANVNSYIITEEGTFLTPIDYATEYPNLKDFLQSNGGLPGTDIYIEKPENENKEIEDMLLEDAQGQENVKKEAEEKEEQGNKPKAVILPTIQSKQLHRDQIDQFDPADLTTKEHQSRSRVLSRALSLIRQKPPPPDSIKSSVIGLFGAQATMLAGGILGTPLGDKTLEVAGKVATDTAEKLKLSAEELDTAASELEWLQTPEKEPTPSPELPKSPPTPVPSPPPKFEFHIDSYERRIRKAKAQMDETKSLAFRAMEELLRAQSTQAHLKRQFVMAQVKEQCKIKRDKFKKEEEDAKAVSNQVLSQHQQRIHKAESISEEVDSLFNKQIANAHQVNCEVSASMRQLGISTRPTVSEWLKQKQEQKNNHLKSTLHNWHRTKQQREIAISLKQAVTSHRALQHVAWGVKKDLSAQLQGLDKPKLTTETGKKKTIISEQEGTCVQSNVPISKRESITHRTITSNGCIRATPVGLVKKREPSPPPKGVRRSYSLPDSTLWEMGQCYVGGVKTFYSGLHHRAYGPKTVHAESTLHFVFPNQYKKTKQFRPSCSPNSIPLSLYPGQHFNQKSTVLYHSMADQFFHKCQKDGVQLAKSDLPMKVIDEQTIITKITA